MFENFKKYSKKEKRLIVAGWSIASNAVGGVIFIIIGSIWGIIEGGTGCGHPAYYTTLAGVGMFVLMMIIIIGIQHLNESGVNVSVNQENNEENK